MEAATTAATGLAAKAGLEAAAGLEAGAGLEPFRSEHCEEPGPLGDPHGVECVDGPEAGEAFELEAFSVELHSFIEQHSLTSTARTAPSEQGGPRAGLPRLST